MAFLSALHAGGGELSDVAHLVTLLENAGNTDLALKTGVDLGVLLENAGRQADARTLVQQLIEKPRASPSLLLSSVLTWFSLTAERAGNHEVAESLANGALAMRESLAPSSLPLAESLSQAGRLARAKGDSKTAEDHFRRAVTIQLELAPDSLEVAAIQNAIGSIVASRGDLVEAERFHRQALNILERVAPGSLELAETLCGLADVAFQRGGDDTPEPMYRRCLAIREKLVPESSETAATLYILGVLAEKAGELPKAEDLYRRSLEIREKLAPDSVNVAWSLSRLGDVARGKGDSRAAEQWYQRALVVAKKAQPDGPLAATVLTQQAFLADARGDTASAEELHHRALAILEKLDPESLVVAGTLNSLGLIAEGRGDLVGAERLYRRSLSLREKLTPDGEEVAWSLRNLGEVARKKGDSTAAEEWYRRALMVANKAQPDGPLAATVLTQQALLADARGDTATAEALHQRALAILEKLDPESLVVASTLNSLGLIAEGRGDLVAAERLYRRSLSLREKLTPNSDDVAWSLSNIGDVALARGEIALAEDMYGRCLAIREKLAPESLDLATTLNDLALVAERGGQVAEAEAFVRRSLAIRERVAPGSLDVAASLSNLAMVLEPQGKLAEARSEMERAWELQRTHEADGEDAATMLNNLGMMAVSAQDFGSAAQYLQQALTIRQRLKPESAEVAQTLSNLAMLALKRGDFAAGRQLQVRAMSIQSAARPNDPQLAAMLGNLALFDMLQGNLALAEEDERKARRLRLELGVGGGEAARALYRLALLAAQRGDVARAREYLEEALRIGEESAPDGSLTLLIRAALGIAAYEAGEKDEGRRIVSEALAKARGEDAMSLLSFRAWIARRDEDWSTAESLLRRAFDQQQQAGVGGVSEANVVAQIGTALGHQGKLREAEVKLRQGLAVISSVLPGSHDEAFALHDLGAVIRKSGRLPEAAELLCRAAANVEAQRARLGGSDDAKALFTASVAEYYRDCEDVLLELGQGERAFHVLERSRARSLLEMLAERDLLFAVDVPEELSRERRVTDAEYDRRLNALGALSSGKDEVRLKEHQASLRELAQKREEIKDRIKGASPRFAALQYPEALDLPRVREILDPGTIYLSFSIGKEKSSLYVVEPRGSGPAAGMGLTVIPLAIGEKALREKVDGLRSLISRGAVLGRGVQLAGATQGPETGSGDQGSKAKELYELLVKPAEKQISAADRVLVSADGPLHVLPFAALVRTKEDGGEEYLIEWRPVHMVVSGTVYAEVKKDREKKRPTVARGPEVVAFGDPTYPPLRQEESGRFADVEVRHAVRSGVSLSPLPFTRLEVEEIVGLYGAGGRKCLGSEATEGRAKAVGSEGARYVHFACHGLLDERFPLNSALALTIPETPKEGEDNGLLQAWEIFEGVRIDADLVTLSACETALGKEMGGEGLVGLTRAFQYAGARSVLASVWSVADESTAVLMKAFYGALKAGKAKDEALREAQLALLKNPRTAHPFHWAAFQIIGDWK